MAKNTNRDQWWVTAQRDALIWARLRVLESGSVDIFDARGQTLRYDDEDAARAALMDAEFRAFDGLDDDDALEFGIDLEDTAPPEGEDDAELRPQMTEKLLRGHSS